MHFPKIFSDSINGLGEAKIRLTTPFFLHPPEKQSLGQLQKVGVEYIMGEPAVRAEFIHSVVGGEERGLEMIELTSVETRGGPEF